METIVISLGGSIVAQETVDTDFLKSFKGLLDSFEKRFIIVVGGGKPARDYQTYARKLGVDRHEALDWIGIKATWLNGELVRAFFGVSAPLVTDPTTTPEFDKYLIGAGYKPGWSTDYDSMLLAKGFGASKVINMSNVDAVYSEDPRENPDAEKFSDLSWEGLQEIVGEEWNPGRNVPFDPVAVKEGVGSGITLCFTSPDLENMKKILDDEEFEGTVVE